MRRPGIRKSKRRTHDDSRPAGKGSIHIPENDRDSLLAGGVAAVYTPKDFELGRIMREIADLAESRRGA